jgi:peptidoglycan/xylan/chitin deacetylase (PgdA/CDA1 family)
LEVDAMASAAISFGNHTASHPNLSRLNADAQRDEMCQAAGMISSRLGNCTSIAYPFGDYDDKSREIALALGHTSIVEVGGVNAPLDLTRIARVPAGAAKSDAQFFAEIEFVAPGRALLKTLLKKFAR